MLIFIAKFHIRFFRHIDSVELIIINGTGEVGLQLQLGASPMTSLGIVTNLVASAHSNPLWNWSILLELLRKLLFNPECLVRRHCSERGGIELLNYILVSGCTQYIFCRLEY